MIGRLIKRALGIGDYTDEHHAGTCEAIAESAERALGYRIVGTCSSCGEPMRLLVTVPRRVVCGCGEIIPPTFLRP